MTEMTPADVPQDLVLAAAWALADVPDTDGSDGTDEIRAMLAAVLPIHERLTREHLAAELRALSFPCPMHNGRDHRCVGCQRYAALVGAARVVAGQDSPSARAVREMRQTQAAGRENG